MSTCPVFANTQTIGARPPIFTSATIVDTTETVRRRQSAQASTWVNATMDLNRDVGKVGETPTRRVGAATTLIGTTMSRPRNAVPQITLGLQDLVKKHAWLHRVFVENKRITCPITIKRNAIKQPQPIGNRVDGSMRHGI